MILLQRNGYISIEEVLPWNLTEYLFIPLLFFNMFLGSFL